jgi:ABC-type nitrate/sulfonate/bicarbonate transport system permease component
VDPVLITVATSMGATRWQIYRKVILPAVLPSVMVGMRVGIVFALLGVLLAEMFAGVRGMGFLMQRLAMAFNAPELFAATLLVSLLSIAVVLCLDHLNRRLGRWR